MKESLTWRLVNHEMDGSGKFEVLKNQTDAARKMNERKKKRKEASDSEVSGANYLRLIGYDVSGQRDGIHESPCADSYRVRDTA